MTIQTIRKGRDGRGFPIISLGPVRSIALGCRAAIMIVLMALLFRKHEEDKARRAWSIE